MAVVLITEDPASQMGVGVQLQGQEYWFTYLEGQVADGKIDEAKRTEWEAKYDGYEMIWSFTNPKVPTGDGNIDAACMQGKSGSGNDYAKGGFCCGIKYAGGFSSQPALWAIWFTTAQLKDFTAALGFSASTIDTANWISETSSFTVSWSVRRWMPKEERAANYYVNEYRFEAKDEVQAFTYVHKSDTKYAKGTPATKVLTGSMFGIASGTAALALTLALISF